MSLVPLMFMVGTLFYSVISKHPRLLSLPLVSSCLPLPNGPMLQAFVLSFLPVVR